MQYAPQELGRFIRDTRKSLGVTQKNLALAAGTGPRFLIELEKGKETCEIGKTLKVPNTLGDIGYTFGPKGFSKGCKVFSSRSI